MKWYVGYRLEYHAILGNWKRDKKKAKNMGSGKCAYSMIYTYMLTRECTVGLLTFVNKIAIVWPIVVQFKNR